MSTTSPPSFDDVKYGFFPSSCSPRFEPGEPDGIKIAAPAKFSVTSREDGHAMLPFCVSMRFNAYYLSKFPQVFEALKVVLVDDENDQVMSGGIWRDRHYIPNPPSPIPREELEKRIALKYSTVNLLEFFRLPARKARYNVYTMLEEHKSNIITIETVPE